MPSGHCKQHLLERTPYGSKIVTFSHPSRETMSHRTNFLPPPSSLTRNPTVCAVLSPCSPHWTLKATCSRPHSRKDPGHPFSLIPSLALSLSHYTSHVRHSETTVSCSIRNWPLYRLTPAPVLPHACDADSIQLKLSLCMHKNRTQKQIFQLWRILRDRKLELIKLFIQKHLPSWVPERETWEWSN